MRGAETLTVRMLSRFRYLAGLMLKKSIGRLFLLLTLIQELGMDAKSGSVLPTTPRKKGIVLRNVIVHLLYRVVL